MDQLSISRCNHAGREISKSFTIKLKALSLIHNDIKSNMLGNRINYLSEIDTLAYQKRVKENLLLTT